MLFGMVYRVVCWCVCVCTVSLCPLCSAAHIPLPYFCGSSLEQPNPTMMMAKRRAYMILCSIIIIIFVIIRRPGRMGQHQSLRVRWSPLNAMHTTRAVSHFPLWIIIERTWFHMNMTNANIASHILRIIGYISRCEYMYLFAKMTVWAACLLVETSYTTYIHYR